MKHLFLILSLIFAAKSIAGLPPTTTKGSGDSSDVTTFKIRAPNIPITHSGSIATIGTIPVAGGGTGQTSLTANNVLLGNGTSGLQVVAPGTSGNVLTSNGTTWASTALPASATNPVSSIGTTGGDIQSVFFGIGTNCQSPCTTGTCTICLQGGNKITSVTFVSTGQYNFNGLDGTKYFCAGAGENSNYLNLHSRKDLSSSSLTRVQSGSTNALENAGAATVFCFGIP